MFTSRSTTTARMIASQRQRSPTGSACAQMQAASRRKSDRRGFSMILVIIIIGFTLSLTYGFMRTQVTSQQLTQNDVRRDLALEAARSGISAGLLRMQSSTWVGITDTYSKTTQQDSVNQVGFAVTFSSVTSGQVAGVSDSELPLHVCVTSVGTWNSPRNSSIQVTRTIKAVVRLMPRLPGRTVRAGDVATAMDLSTNPANYQATLPYTLTTTSSSSTPLTLDPGARIEGPVWTRKLSIYNSENWSSTVRSTMLTEIGNEYGASSPTAAAYPHPLNGPVTFTKSPSGTVQTDLSQLKTPWSTSSATASIGSLSTSAWQSYCLYHLGPVYQAGTLQNSLTNVTLSPSTSNPLGIFVRNGNLDVYGQVGVQGTLVVTGTLSFWGQGSAVTSFNWYGSSGVPVVSGADQWPRLPAVVANQLSLSSQAAVVIEGPVILNGQLSGGGGDFNYPSANQVNLSGTATATRGQQPYSTVQLVGSPDLSTISGNTVYAIWLANGTTGRWYPIQSVNNTAKTLTVVGEASIASPVSYKIRLNLTQFASLNGPVVASSVNLSTQEMWQLSSSAWNSVYNNWVSTNNNLQLAHQPHLYFPDYLANSANFLGLFWLVPYQTSLYGLQMQPTVSLQPTSGLQYLANPPLFTPYSSTGSDASSSGYRWQIVDWREDI